MIIKKIIGIVSLVIGIFFILSGFLFMLITLLNGVGITINHLITFLISSLSSIFFLILGIKLLKYIKSKKIIGIIICIIGGLFLINLIISLFYIDNSFKGMNIAFSIISISLLVIGSLLIKSRHQIDN